ncbi:hypothetical protein CGRA01v4_01421 [Colletotrichum graminicola]|nr:hypothetical protein CGRA01v4_01421 [Colletotrichum graminicola]
MGTESGNSSSVLGPIFTEESKHSFLTSHLFHLPLIQTRQPWCTAQDDVTIVGGGIAGMALTLLPAAQSIPATIYEFRSKVPPSPYHAGGGMMLCRNALRILDSLGLYEPLLSKAYSFDYVYYKNDEEDEAGVGV